MLMKNLNLSEIKNLMKTIYTLADLLSSVLVQPVQNEKNLYYIEEQCMLPLVKRLVEDAEEGVVFSYNLQFKLYDEKDKALNKQAKESMKAILAKKDDILNNPNIPEATKNLFRNLR